MSPKNLKAHLSWGYNALPGNDTNDPFPVFGSLLGGYNWILLVYFPARGGGYNWILLVYFPARGVAAHRYLRG